MRPEKALAKWPAARARAGDQQRARRVLVEPVDQLGPRAALVGEPVEQPVEMLVGLGPALRREARRLVEHERVRILVDDHLADELGFLVGQRLALALRPRRSRAGAASAGGTRISWPASIRSPGVARLPSSRSWPVRAQRETMLKLTSGRLPLEPAVEPDAVVVLGDGEGARRRLMARALSEC